MFLIVYFYLQILPFPSVQQFHEEYTCAYANDTDMELDDLASLQTFRDAYKVISNKGTFCRMMTAKGNFSTCGTCNVAAYLLANRGRRLYPAERDLVLKYR